MISMESAVKLDPVSFGYLIHQSSEGIIAFDANYRVNLVNPAFTQIFGIDATSVEGTSLFDLVNIFDAEADEFNVKAALAGKTTQSKGRVFRNLTTDQEVHYVAKFVPLDNDAGGAVFITNHTPYLQSQEQVARNMHYHQVINYFTSSLIEKSSVEDILWDVVENCISGLGLVDCMIYLLDETGTHLIQKASIGSKGTKDRRIVSARTLKIGEGIVGSVAKSGFAEIVDDVSQDPRYLEDEPLFGSEIAVPMFYEGQVIGVIDSEHPQKSFYQEYHLEILNTIGSLCASKVMQAMAEQMMRESEERKQLALQGADLGLWDLDLVSGTITHNEHWAEMLGYRLDELENNTRISGTSSCTQRINLR